MRMVLVGVLVMMLDGRVEAAPDPEREYTPTEDGPDHQREEKLHHGIRPRRRTGRPVPAIARGWAGPVVEGS